MIGFKRLNADFTQDGFKFELNVTYSQSDYNRSKTYDIFSYCRVPSSILSFKNDVCIYVTVIGNGPYDIKKRVDSVHAEQITITSQLSHSEMVDLLRNKSYIFDEFIMKFDENGLLHSTMEPASINHNTGEELWYVHGVLNRSDGPAVVNKKKGIEEWWLNGKRHRLGDYALIDNTTGEKQYWEYGRKIKNHTNVYYLYKPPNKIIMLEETEMNRKLLCETIECKRVEALKINNTITIYFDEEGLLNNSKPNYLITDAIRCVFNIPLRNDIIGNAIIEYKTS